MTSVIMALVDYLHTISLFKGLKPEQLELLASQFKPRRYFAGEALVAQGDLGNRFFVLESGVVNLRVTDANGIEHSHGVLPAAPVPGSTLPPKNYFGEQMFEMQQPFEFQAYAVTDVDAYILDRGDLDAALLMHQHLLHAMPFIEEAKHRRTHGLNWVEPGEVVTAVFHKHWWALVPALAKTASIAVTVLLISFALGFFGFGIANIVLVVGAIIVLMFFGLELYDWRNDEYIMTTLRVAHVERQYISVELTEGVPFDKIIGSKVESNGIAGIIGVSNVVIQTAGRQEGNVSFAYVGNGEQIVKLIEQQRGKVRALRAADQRERERDRVQQKLREYILPHVVARERAETAARIPPPAPPPPPSAWRRAQNLIRSMFQLEMKKDSVVTWRKHWIVLLDQEYKIVLGLIGLDAIFVFLAYNPGLQVLPFGGYLFAGLTLLAIGLFGVWWQWEDWRNDTYAVTATQVIDAERLPLGIREKSITAQLDQVQDVRVEVDGIWATLLHYGNLKIETAGQGSQMIFKNIYHPREASEEIFRHIEDLRKRIMEREADIRDRVTIDSLIGYDRIRKEEERHNRDRNAELNRSDDDADDDDDDNDDDES